jgi:peroxiredoxin
MRITIYAAAVLFSAVASAFTVKAGDKVPSADLHFGFPPLFVDTAEYLAGRNVIVVGLPGAFTPT